MIDIRKQILEANDCRMEPVEIPEWGVTAFMRELSLSSRLELIDRLTAEENQNKNLYVFAILYTLTNEEGKPLFALEDYDLVAGKNGDVALRVGKLCVAFNRLFGDPVEKKDSN